MEATEFLVSEKTPEVDCKNLSIIPVGICMFKVNNENSRAMSDHKNDIIDVFLVSLLLTFSKLCTLFRNYHC